MPVRICVVLKCSITVNFKQRRSKDTVISEVFHYEWKVFIENLYLKGTIN